MRFYLIIASLFVCISLSSQEVTQTLSTNQKDVVTITYEAKKKDGKMHITFTDFNRKLGPTHREEYKDLGMVKVLFFDRPDSRIYNISGLTPKTISVPESMHYTLSDDGCFILQKGQPLELTVELSSDNSDEQLSIPVYLAEYKERRSLLSKNKKSTFDLFAECTERLSIAVPKAKGSSTRNGLKSEGTQKTQEVVETITSEEELVDDAMPPEEEARLRLAEIPELLYCDDMERLDVAINGLENLKYKKMSNGLQSRISDAISKLRERKQEINPERKREDEKEVLRKETEKQIAKVKSLLEKQESLPFSDELKDAMEELDELNSRALELGASGLSSKISKTQASCETKKSEIEAAKDKKRTIWMIIGGAILAVVAFIGNQVFQSFRFRRQMRDSQAMTNDIASRMERNIKQRASSKIRGQVSKVEGDIRRKSRDAVRSNIDGLVKGTMKGKKNVKI